MKYFMLAFFLLAVCPLWAQKGVLHFKEKEVVLKNLKADDEPTTVNFEFKNTGHQPVIISRVVPVFSQIKAEWEHSPVAPGKSSVIKVSFPSSTMPVDFNYGITVISNAGTGRDMLRLKGNIVDNPKKPALLYKYAVDGLRFKSSVVTFGNVPFGETKRDTAYFYNTSDREIKIAVRYKPSYMHVEIPQTVVKPGKRGMLVLSLDAAKKNDYGYLYDNVILSINDDNSFKNRLSFSAHITEDFSKLTPEERAKAPVAAFDKSSVDFGEVKQGEKVDCDFVLKNTGKTALIVRKTRASCGCTAVTLGDTQVEPGKATTIRATFNSAGRTGRQYKTITVITNDPEHAETMLTISGNIVTPGK